MELTFLIPSKGIKISFRTEASNNQDFIEFMRLKLPDHYLRRFFLTFIQFLLLSS